MSIVFFKQRNDSFRGFRKIIDKSAKGKQSEQNMDTEKRGKIFTAIARWRQMIRI